jgi:hypothetical protein
MRRGHSDITLLLGGSVEGSKIRILGRREETYDEFVGVPPAH